MKFCMNRNDTELETQRGMQMAQILPPLPRRCQYPWAKSMTTRNKENFYIGLTREH